MRKKAIHIYVPEEIDALLAPWQKTDEKLTADETLALVVRHARASLYLSDEDKAQLRAEWANRSAVIFVRV